MCQELFTIVNKKDKNLSIQWVYILVWVEMGAVDTQ